MPSKRIASDDVANRQSIGKSQGQKPKPHECCVCHQTFRRAEHLKRHFRRHTLERPFRCWECGMCFSRKELHKRHCLNFHGHSSSNLPSPEILPQLSPGEALAIVRSPSHVHGLTQQSDVRRENTETPTKTYDSPDTQHTLLPKSNTPADPRRDSQDTIYHTPGSSFDTLIPSSVSFYDSSLLTNPLTDTLSPNNNVEEEMTTSDLIDLSLHKFHETGSELYQPLYRQTPSLNENIFQIPPGTPQSLADNSLWVPSLDSLYPLNTLSHFSTAITPISRTFPEESIEYFSNDTTTTNQAIEAWMASLTLSSNTSTEVMHLPGFNSRSKYWEEFWFHPNPDFPFIHAASTSVEDSPQALVLAILAYGAMYCGDKDIGMILLECSRRLVSRYIDSSQSMQPRDDFIPLWAVQTLLINAIFGIPGRDLIQPTLMVGSLESLLDLAAQTNPAVDMPLDTDSSVEDEWNLFIYAESRRRLLLCVGIFVKLWSVTYNISPTAISRFWAKLSAPASDSLWEAPSAIIWSDLKLCEQLSTTPPRIRTIVDSLFSETTSHSGVLTGMGQIVGLLICLDDLRNSSSMTLDQLSEHFETAIDNWAASHYRIRHKMALCRTMESFVRASLCVETEKAMKMFMDGRDFLGMRRLLRQGDLRAAGRHALTNLIPWSATHKSQISMLALTCALVVFESSLLAHAEEMRDELHDVLHTPVDYSDIPSNAVRLCLRRIVENGPIILAAMNKYSSFIQDELQAGRLRAVKQR